MKKRAAENPKSATSTNNVPPQELINSEIEQDSKKPPQTIAKPKQRPRKAKLTLRKPVVSAATNRTGPKASTRISDFPARAPTPSSSQAAETKKAADESAARGSDVVLDNHNDYSAVVADQKHTGNY